MANELTLNATETGLTVTAEIFLNGVQQGSAISCPEIGASGFYIADFPVLAAGSYGVNFISNSQVIHSGVIEWAGTYEQKGTAILRNVAGQVLPFVMVSNSGNPSKLSGLTVTVQRAFDGATSFSATTGTVTEAGNGVYWFNPSAADTDAEEIVYMFTATGAQQREVSVTTRV